MHSNVGLLIGKRSEVNATNPEISGLEKFIL